MCRPGIAGLENLFLQFIDSAIELLCDRFERFIYDRFQNNRFSLHPGKPFPKYDDAKTIYNDLLTRLDAANGNLNTSTDSYGSADIIYVNKENYEAAAAAIGGDFVETKLWWDKF